MNSIVSVERKNCTGCGACLNICPNVAIEMKQTVEGFSYPYTDPDKCTMCGKCFDICPAANNILDTQPTWYLFSADNLTLWDSVGGGAVTSAIKNIFTDGINVFTDKIKIYAPTFEKEKFNIHHELLNVLKNLPLLCQITYAESNAWQCFSEIKHLINKNKKIVFLGTPCQTDGLRRSINNDNDNLITIAIMCNGVSSNFVWSDYLQSRNKNSKVNMILLSPKKSGVRESIHIHFDDDSLYEETEKGDWLTAYHKGYVLRQSCLNCKYNNTQFYADIIIGNYSSINNGDGKGTSIIGINSNKGLQFVEKFIFGKNCSYRKISQSDADKLFNNIGNHEINYEERKKFFEMCYTHGFNRSLKALDKKNDDICIGKKYILDYHADDPLAWKILNNDVWYKREFNRELYLFASGEKWKRIFLPLNFSLKSGRQYHYNIKLKLKTDIQEVRIMLAEKAAADSIFNILHKIMGFQNDTWLIISGVYVPTTDILKYIMLASTDFTGSDPYVCFDWIRIWED